MSRQKHPDAAAIASFRAGLTGRFRGRRLAAHIADCDGCASVSDELGEVSSVLASMRAPTLPDAFESRITAALAAESAARASATGTSPAAERAAGKRGAAHRQPGTARRARPPRSRELALRFRPAMAVVPLVVLLLVGLGYLVSRPGSSSSSSSAALSEGSPSAAAKAPSVRQPAAAAAPVPSAAASASVPFYVITTGTRYEAATLRAQVRGELTSMNAAAGTGGAGQSAVQSSSASGPEGASSGARNAIISGPAPSRNLIGCVLHLTGNVLPTLVDRATYQGKPVYVIVVPSKAWVVGLDCTAARPDLITSVSLTAAP